MSRVHLVTQAYGKEEIRTEALYALWSALAWRGELPLDVHVYTDEAAPFAALQGRADVRVLSPEEIRDWRGPHDFVHRVKATMIRDMVRRFPREKLAYVDADVLFTAPLDALFARIGPGRSVLHLREYSVATHDSAQMRKFRAHMGALSFRGRPLDLSRDMWNAGVVGMDPSIFAIVNEWMDWIDAIYPHYKRGLVEQYGICRLLQREGAVGPTDDLVFHYWFQKDDYVAAIRRELAAVSALGFDAALAHLRANPIRLPRRHRRLTLRDRLQHHPRLRRLLFWGRQG
jgi:hypothetical protein